MEGIRIGQFSLVANKEQHHYDCYDQNGNMYGYPVSQVLALEIENLQNLLERCKPYIKELNEDNPCDTLRGICVDPELTDLNSRLNPKE
jgi:hypothetical protein